MVILVVLVEVHTLVPQVQVMLPQLVLHKEIMVVMETVLVQDLVEQVVEAELVE